MMVRARQVQHLSANQRSKIRNSMRSEHALSRLYGVSVRTIRLVQATRDSSHPARVAAAVRRLGGEVAAGTAVASVHGDTLLADIG